MGNNCFITKAIYFDKPPSSNWFVPFHQDLNISVTKKHDIEGYNSWTFKNGINGVHTPLDILKSTLKLRLYLDNTTKENGALRVIPKSHNKGIILKNPEDWNVTTEKTCEVNCGDVMLMKPLLIHASNRTISNKPRRVIHLEINTKQLKHPLNWLEYNKI
jgi:ectoine hydroxylase-related dioxygenase (phytanoyl-CoA dioxygenase family)